MSSGHRFFLDRDLGGRILVGVLRAAGWDATTSNERYTAAVAERLADSDWIRDVARDFVIISSDHSIGKRPIQAAAIRYCSARILIVNAAATAGDQAASLLGNTIRLQRLIARRDGPWVYGVHRDGLRTIHLVDA